MFLTFSKRIMVVCVRRMFILIMLNYPKLSSSQGWTNIYIYEHGRIPKEELAHDPGKGTAALPKAVNDSLFLVPEPWESPDYRLPEPPFTAHVDWFYKESHRPYRLNPYTPQFYKFNKYIYYEHVNLLGCGCCAVYKRLIPLATCALLTTRHILTTATATEMVLNKYGNRGSLENILGAWYDAGVYNEWKYNSSYYASVARIHYHPRYNFPDRLNRSHPLPCCFDLSIWATTFTVIGGDGRKVLKAMPCSRGVSSSWHYQSTTVRNMELMHLVGYQFVWDLNRRPSPFHKYFVRTRSGAREPCPKIEWGWFHCVEMRSSYGKYGFDVGGLKFLQTEDVDYRTSGLVGINTFTMRLRSRGLVNYFTVLDRYCVLDWFYSAYMGRQKYRWLDHRFQDTQFAAPRLKSWLWIPIYHPAGEELVYSGWLPYN